MAVKRAFRLRKNSDFQRVRQQGRAFASRLLILTWMPNEEARARVGFVVSKRVAKLAVQRNYYKRLLSEGVRPALPCLRSGCDIVISAKSALVRTDAATLMRDVRTLLRQAQLINRDCFAIAPDEQGHRNAKS